MDPVELRRKGRGMRLFALQETTKFGSAIADAAGIELDPLEEREFADGEYKLRPLISVRGEDVYVVHALHGGAGRSPSDKLLRLLFFVATCRDNGAARVTVMVPYMPFMRKDQQTKPRDPVTTRYVAAIVEAVGTDMVVALEVHNPAAFQNAFRCRTTHLDMAEIFADRIAQLADEARVVFLSPDGGGVRRAHHLLQAFCADGRRIAGFGMMEKHRSEGVVTGDLFAGSVEGADVFIVDDMISTGGTILRAAEACRARGARSISAVATHGLFSAGAAEMFDSPALDRIIVSDSAAPFQIAPEHNGAKLEVISAAPLMASAMERLHGGGSIHRLLNPVP